MFAPLVVCAAFALHNAGSSVPSVAISGARHRQQFLLGQQFELDIKVTSFNLPHGARVCVRARGTTHAHVVSAADGKLVLFSNYAKVMEVTV